MLVAPYKTKKALKEAKGTTLRYQETSHFGLQYPQDGNGTFAVVGPGAYERKWFAEVTVTDHIITKVL